MLSNALVEVGEARTGVAESGGAGGSDPSKAGCWSTASQYS